MNTKVKKTFRDSSQNISLFTQTHTLCFGLYDKAAPGLKQTLDRVF